MAYWTTTAAAKSAADSIRANAARVASHMGGLCATDTTVEAARLHLRLIREDCDRLERELSGAMFDADAA